MLRFAIAAFLAICFANCSNPAIEEESLTAIDFINRLNKRSSERNNLLTKAVYNYESNITDETLQKQLEISLQVAKETKNDWKELITFNWPTYTDYDLRRQFKKYSVLGTTALPEDKYKKLEKIISDMQKVYATAKVCDYKDKEKCDLSLEPEITELLTTSRDPEELKHLWVQWRSKTGVVRNMYKEYVDLSNEAARLNNFTDNTGLWLDNYEDPKIQEQFRMLWEQLKPLYTEFHAYVRHKLRQKYGEIVSEKGPIPAHLLGNMWAQTWSNVLDFTLPYPGKKKFDVTAEMIKQGYTPLKMFQTAEEFFISIGLSPMPPLFWDNSIIEKPKDGRELVCHASAWDFYDGKDFRIKMCSTVKEEDFETVHHEMGHVEYFLQYKDQPAVYREGANEGFHEAIGDLIALSVGTTKHLKKLKLLPDIVEDEEVVINDLYKVALSKIAFLPFGYLMDLWRWDVFSGKTKPEDYNCRWWDLRTNLQGVEPPLDRSENDFDPAGKYHIVANVPYMRYFVSFVIQFQFHRALCEEAGEYDPNDPTKKTLYSCDIYENKEAGSLLKKVLEMGSSRPWPDAMEALTGQREMNANGILEYFRPLYRWLETYNKKNGVHVGWESSQKKCISSSEKKLTPTQ